MGTVVCYNDNSFSERERIKEIIIETAKKHGVDPELALKVAEIESNFNQSAVSEKGAIGVMQLMPQTARELGVNPYDLRENIEGGIRYLKMMLEKYPSVELALAAYNAGPSAVDRYNGIPPYSETIRYVRKIIHGKTVSVRKSSNSIRKVVLPNGTVIFTNLPYVGYTR